MFESGQFCLKQLVQRPSLARWHQRFESAYEIETVLSLHNSFLPKPVPRVRDRLGVAIVPLPTSGNAWFLAHDWANLRPLHDYEITHSVLGELGTIIATVADLPLSLAVPRIDMDDDTPTPAHLYRSATRSPLVTKELAARFGDVISTLTLVPTSAKQAFCPVLGHRDLSKKNVLLCESGALIAVDWENCGLSTLEEEIGRAIVHWVNGERSEELIPALVNSATKFGKMLSAPSVLWFSSWLSGHLSFLGYLLTANEKCPTDLAANRITREIEQLITFAQMLSRTITTLHNIVRT